MPRDAASADFIDSRFVPGHNESRSSGVSWVAVIAGAFVAAAFYLILLALGAGLGLSSVSPWANRGASVAAITAAAIAWLIFIEVAASALGGYLTGRLRTKWAMIHDDEVYFRDTANGFLAWAVALIVTVTFLASAATSMTGSVTERTPNAIDPNAYFVDMLFRSDRGGEPELVVRAEAGRILANALRKSEMPAQDRTYLTRLVAARTSISTADADRRVSEVLNEARQAEDAARKATARFLLWMFLALIIGAFAASYSATIGGRQRDHVPTHE